MQFKELILFSRKLTLFSVFLLTNISVYSQTIQGYISDPLSGQGIPGVKIMFDNNYVFTDSLGHFTFDILSGTEQIVGNDVIISPNPAGNFLFLTNIHTDTNIEICNSSGIMVLKVKYQNDYLDISALLDGLYILRYETADRFSYLKFIKR